MTNIGQLKQNRFTELMIQFQRETIFTGELPADLYEWKWAAMQFICIKKSGIKPKEFADMLTKREGYTVLEMAHVVSSIELRPARDLELELEEFVACQEQILLLREQLNDIIAPQQKALEDRVQKEFEVPAEKETFSKTLKKEFAKKNKTIPLGDKIGEA